MTIVRSLVLASTVLAVMLVGFVAVRLAQAFRLFPAGSLETVQLTNAKRVALEQLMAEKKFGPNEFPPLGYTGAATPEDEALGSSAVNDVISGVLASRSGSVEAKHVSGLIKIAMKRVDLLDTEDRDRTAGYLVEIWYILGFKGATGRFAYGSAFPRPTGYGEPLPPGWAAPDKPRLIGPPP